MSTSDDLASQVRNTLKTKALGHPLRSYPSIDSTNTYARKWAEDGASHGSTVSADYQTAGKGRLGRQWDAEAGSNLMFSFVLRPERRSNLTLVSLVVALGVSDALQDQFGATVGKIKWPNDVLCGGRKVCGLLLERLERAGDTVAVIAGVGLNANQQHFPDAIRRKATSLMIATGRPVDRAALFSSLLLNIERRYDQWEAKEDDAIIETVNSRLAHRGTPVQLTHTHEAQEISGTALGIDTSGGLRLNTASGERIVYAGDVTSQPAVSS